MYEMVQSTNRNLSGLYTWDCGDIQMVAGIYERNHFSVSHKFNISVHHHLNFVDRPFKGSVSLENASN
jgi:hypothetical protein